ncbi:MAG: hypothetical protein HC859_09720 [Bacteroidia bacterium]|nr:hypothetical protein [Bacteroidia bacterium]
MRHVHYQETQRFYQLPWLWVAAGVVFTGSLVVTYIADAGQHEYADPQLTWLILFAAWIPLIAILALGRYDLRIDTVGVHYRFMPRAWKWRLIPRDNIASVEVRKSKNLHERISCGYKRHVFDRKIFMNIAGRSFIEIVCKDGKRIVAGTTDPESARWALSRMEEQKES